MIGTQIALLAFGFVIFVGAMLALAEWFVRYIIRKSEELRKKR